ncbi:MAG: hypothetical protein FJX72_15415, partial [Armatimonadetes bacterium]|nr:hypothetical protein [Armatimonadota bacterium]
MTATQTDMAPSQQAARPTASRLSGAEGTARAALALCAVVLALMVANAVASRRIDPAKAATLIALQHDLTLHPGDEALRTRVRREDMRVRRDYLRHRDFAVRGAWILLAGLIVYLVASELARRSAPSAPIPRPDAAARARASAEATFRAVVGVGGLLAGALVTLTVLARHDSLAEYARAASHGPANAAKGAASAASGQPAPGGLPIATAKPGGPTDAGVPQPVGGALSGAGTQLVPLPTNTAGPGAGAAKPDPSLAAKPPVQIKAALGPGWAENWPRFRGPEGTGAAPDRKPPIKWDGARGENILWKTPVPLPGWNSPIVWGDRVYLSGADASKREVYAFDLNSGAIVWRTPIPLPAGVTVPKVQADTGHAPATIVTDGARICAMFVTGDVACLDMNGKLVWTRQLGPLDNPYGHATSPIIFG